MRYCKNKYFKVNKENIFVLKQIHLNKNFYIFIFRNTKLMIYVFIYHHRMHFLTIKIINGNLKISQTYKNANYYIMK